MWLVFVLNHIPEFPTYYIGELVPGPHIAETEGKLGQRCSD